MALWKKAAEPLEATWAAGVKKGGGDPAAVMKELREQLVKFDAIYDAKRPKYLDGYKALKAAIRPWGT